jgi:hypothetical protein
MSAFPTMKVGTHEQAAAKRTTNFAAAHVEHSGAAFIPRSNLRALEADVERRLRGVSPGRVHARRTIRGNVYLEHKHPGRAGNESVLTHFSAHPTNSSMRDSAIGSHHVKTEDTARTTVLAQARIVGAVRNGVPSFTDIRHVVGRPGLPPGYESKNLAASVARAMAEGYTEFAQSHPSAMALGGAGGAGLRGRSPGHGPGGGAAPGHGRSPGHGPGGGAAPGHGRSPGRHGPAHGHSPGRHGPGGGAGPRHGRSPGRHGPAHGHSPGRHGPAPGHGPALGHGPGGGAGPRHGPGGGAGTRGRPGGGRRKRYTRKN